MDRKYLIAIISILLFSQVFSISFDDQKSKRDSIIKNINDNKTIVNSEKIFEDIPWGTTLETVKKSEVRPLLNEMENELDYEVKIDSLTAILVYAFNNQRLDSIMLLLREEDNYDVYNVEYSDILHNLVSEMKLYLGEPVYSDTLREKDIKRYPTKDINTINSINYIWNFTNTRVKASRTNAPSIPIIIKYKSKIDYSSIPIKKEMDFNRDKGWFYKHKNLLFIAVLVLLGLRVFARILRIKKKINPKK